MLNPVWRKGGGHTGMKQRRCSSVTLRHSFTDESPSRSSTVTGLSRLTAGSCNSVVVDQRLTHFIEFFRSFARIGLNRVLSEHGLDQSPNSSLEATHASGGSAGISDLPFWDRSGFRELNRVLNTYLQSSRKTDALNFAHGKGRKTEWQHVYRLNDPHQVRNSACCV